MKKLSLVAILALAFTSFACGDDKKDDDSKNDQQTEKLDNDKACTKHDDCKSAFCQKQDATNSLCKAKIADNGTCKNADDLCSSSGFSCKDEGEGLKCLNGSSQAEDEPCTGTNEEKIKCYDQKDAKRILACVEADNNYHLDSDNEEELQKRASGSEDFYYLKTRPYSKCLNEWSAFLDCSDKIKDCSTVLATYFDEEESSDYGDCTSAKDAFDECTEDEANLPKEIYNLCYLTPGCAYFERGEEPPTDLYVQCAEEEDTLPAGACRTAKIEYYNCITLDTIVNEIDSFCDGLNDESQVSACSGKLEAMNTACASGT